MWPRNWVSMLVVAVLMTWSIESRSADMTVFGLKIGEPLSLKECATSWGGFLSSRIYTPDLKTTCYERVFNIDSKIPVESESLYIVFAYDQKPGIAIQDLSTLTSDVGKPGWGSSARVEIVNGNLEAVSFDTKKIDAPDVLEILKQKYGEPKIVAPSEKQNLYGAQFSSTTYIWNFPELSVSFETVGRKVDTGHVSIRTPKGDEALLENNKSRVQSGAPL